MADYQATVKGLIFLGGLDYLLKTYGEEKYQQYVSYMPEEAQQKIKSKQILPISQLPASWYIGLMDAYIKIWGEKEGIDAFQKGAAAVAFKDLGTVMKFFMKIGSPSITGSKFPTSYSRYFSHGKITITAHSSTSLNLRLEDAKDYGRAGCLGSLGWMKEALSYSGARDLIARHDECVFAGKPACTFSFKWK